MYSPIVLVIFAVCLSGTSGNGLHLGQQMMEKVEIANRKDKLMQEDQQIDLYDDMIENKNKIINELQSQFNLYKNKVDQLALSSIKSEIDQLAAVKCDELHNKLVVSLSDIKKLNEHIEILVSQNVDDAIQLQDLKNQILQRNETITQQDLQIYDLENQIKDSVNKLNKLQEQPPNSCLPFGNSPGVHQIKAKGIDPFDVLCDSQTAGAGWMVIQQRLDGKENFTRDWATYRQGFGSFKGDFFLGLERIHLLTSERQHELYIHMEMFNGTLEYAQYDHFNVSSVDDQYKLIELGQFSGNTTFNNFAMHTKMNFTTFDRDNDIQLRGNCAEQNGGWWYTWCVYVNLNGQYFNKSVRNESSMHWHDGHSLRSVKMLIRPKAD